MAGTRPSELVPAGERNEAFVAGAIAGFGIGVVFACWVVLRK